MAVPAAVDQQVEAAGVDHEADGADDAELDHLAVEDADDSAEPVEESGSRGVHHAVNGTDRYRENRPAAAGRNGVAPARLGSPTVTATAVPSGAAPRRTPGGFPVVGVVGGGQLARMMRPRPSASASSCGCWPRPPTRARPRWSRRAGGPADDLEAIRAFARGCAVVTFDHEHVPQEVLAALAADGVVLRPGPDALRFAQDKAAMRKRLTARACRAPRGPLVRDRRRVDRVRRGGRLAGGVQDPDRRVRRQGGARRGATPPALDDWLASGPPGPRRTAALLAEERVDFRRELAVLVARSPMGQAAAWPVVETVQTDGICTEVMAPAPGLDPGLAAAATATGLRIAGELDVTGVLAVEMFEVRGGRRHRRRTSSTSWPCGRTTPGTGRSTAA